MLHLIFRKTIYIFQLIIRQITCRMVEAVFFIRFLNIHFHFAVRKHFRVNNFGFIIQSKKRIHHLYHLRKNLCADHRLSYSINIRKSSFQRKDAFSYNQKIAGISSPIAGAAIATASPWRALSVVCETSCCVISFSCNCETSCFIHIIILLCHREKVVHFHHPYIIFGDLQHLFKFRIFLQRLLGE